MILVTLSDHDVRGVGRIWTRAPLDDLEAPSVSLQTSCIDLTDLADRARVVALIVFTSCLPGLSIARTLGFDDQCYRSNK